MQVQVQVRWVTLDAAATVIAEFRAAVPDARPVLHGLPDRLLLVADPTDVPALRVR